MTPETSQAPRKSRAADSVFGYLIPLVFIAIAAYQEINDGKIDKYIIGALLVFGLGSLGWRIDTILEKYLERRNGPPAK